MATYFNMTVTTDPTFFNLDFFRTLLSVLAGGLISLGSVLLVEWVKKLNEKKEKKRVLYKKLISSINSIRRLEINCLEHGMAFNYHKTAYRLDKKDSHAKAQGEYHQQKRDELATLLFDKVEALDSYALDYEILCGNDERFKSLIREINQWPRPDLSRFKNVSTLTDLNNTYDSEMAEKRKFASDYWYNAVGEIGLYISKTLL